VPRKKLDRPRDFIQIVVDPEDKAAFDAWCMANSTTMSEVIRKQIAPFIAKGKKIVAKPTSNRTD
jgi:hypothetical protein